MATKATTSSELSAASVAYHLNNQLRDDNEVKLFEGSGGYENGEQRRDFIHVDDTVKVKNWFKENPHISGIYNVGAGVSRTFNDIANCVLGVILLRLYLYLHQSCRLF